MKNALSKLRPSPAMVVGVTALVVATSGAAIALPGKNTVTKNDIKNGAVTTKKIAKGAVGSQQIKGKSIKGNRLKDGTIKEKQVAEDGLTTANIADVKTIGPVKVTATDGVDENTARTAAPLTELFTKGQITIEAKCFRDTTADVLYGELYVKTSANGAIVQGTDTLAGGNAATDFLNTDTPEVDRQLDTQQTGATSASYGESEFSITSADGATQLLGIPSIAVKNGALAGGNGVYGDGNVCLFGLQVTG
jgi:hypothetical protein